MNINKVMLLGRVGKDPEVRYLENGVAVARLTLATSESYKKDGEKITVTEWHNVVAWRGVAEIIEKYVKKGSEIYIEGKLKQRTWEDNEGKKRYITEINVENLQLGRRPEDSTNEANNATYQNTLKKMNQLQIARFQMIVMIWILSALLITNKKQKTIYHSNCLIC